MIGVSSACLVEQPSERVDVDARPAAVEPIAIPLAGHGITKQAARVPDRLIKAMAASLRVLARPEGLEDLIALRAFTAKREKCDQLERAGPQAPTAPLTAVDCERTEERDERASVGFCVA